MLYTAHFGLRQAPFQATPDPRLFYSNAVYREAYATLLYGVLQRKGFIALTGEVGTGKTTLIRRLMDELDGSVRFVLFYNTTLTFDETVESICAELDLPVEGTSRVQRLQRLNDLLLEEAQRGGNVVLVVDEAQNLSAEVLENLRLVSNLETSTEKLLQIVLVGQPELDARLAEPALRQVAQRITVRYRLAPLADHEIERFIDHRLRLCGSSRPALFSTAAIRRIAAYADGAPRLVNILCDGALLAAYGAEMPRVTSRLVDEVAADLRLWPRRGAAGRPGPARRPGADGRRRTAGPLRWATAGLAAMTVAGAVAALHPGSPLTAGFTGHLGLRQGGPGDGAGVLAPSPAPRDGASVAAATPDDADIPAARALPPREAPPPRPPEPRSSAGATRWRTAVPDGASVSEVVLRHYGRHQLLGLDLVKELNPHLPDLDRVAAGERLWMPVLAADALTRRQPDGSYRVIVTSLLTPEGANRLADRLRHGGARARVEARDITSRLKVHRVVVEGLENPDAVRQTWRTVRQLGWAPPGD